MKFSPTNITKNRISTNASLLSCSFVSLSTNRIRNTEEFHLTCRTSGTCDLDTFQQHLGHLWCKVNSPQSMDHKIMSSHLMWHLQNVTMYLKKSVIGFLKLKILHHEQSIEIWRTVQQL